MHIGSVLIVLGLRHRYVCLGILHRGLILPRVQLEQKLALLHEKAVLVILPEQIALYLRSDVGVHRAVQLRHPFVVDGHVLLHDVGDQDLGRTGFGFSSLFSHPLSSRSVMRHAPKTARALQMAAPQTGSMP